ncbi:hypothetical protein PR048_019782, partial [Dryococelus australis]
MIGCLLYAILASRADLCASVIILSRYQSDANECVLRANKRILRYVKGTVDHKLVYNSDNNDVLVGYVDADWGRDCSDRKSTTGFASNYLGVLLPGAQGSKIDNQSAIKAAKSTEGHRRLKHIDIKYNFIREALSANIVEISYLKSEDQIADTFTNSLAKDRFCKFRKLVG